MDVPCKDQPQGTFKKAAFGPLPSGVWTSSWEGPNWELECIAPDPVSSFLSWIQHFIAFVFCSKLSKEKFGLPGTDINFLSTENPSRCLCQDIIICGFGYWAFGSWAEVRTGCKLVFTSNTNIAMQFVAAFSLGWKFKLILI